MTRTGLTAEIMSLGSPNNTVKYVSSCPGKTTECPILVVTLVVSAASWSNENTKGNPGLQHWRIGHSWLYGNGY